MPTFSDHLEEHRVALVTQIEKLESEVAERTRLLRQLQLKLESILGLMRIEGTAPVQSERHFLEVAHDHLLQNGAMHYLALAAALRAQGVFIPGVKPEANLLAHISRDQRFTKTRRGTYRVESHASARDAQPKPATRAKKVSRKTK